MIKKLKLLWQSFPKWILLMLIIATIVSLFSLEAGIISLFAIAGGVTVFVWVRSIWLLFKTKDDDNQEE
jgi:hypothetical protein